MLGQNRLLELALKGLKTERLRLDEEMAALGGTTKSCWEEVAQSCQFCGKSACFHWYEAHGIGRRELKLKLPLLD
jgi:hypothetical protein